MLLLPCDIILVRHRGAFLSSAIRFFESLGDRGRPSIASHTGLITKPGEWLDATITEALSHVVEHKMSEGYSNPKEEFVVFRPLNLTDDQKATITAKAQSFIGSDYGYLKIAAQMFDNMLGGYYLFRRLCRVNKWPICSYVVGAAYETEGLNFGVSYHAVTPDDIWDFCVGNPVKYQFIGQQGTMYKEAG